VIPPFEGKLLDDYSIGSDFLFLAAIPADALEKSQRALVLSPRRGNKTRPALARAKTFSSATSLAAVAAGIFSAPVG